MYRHNIKYEIRQPGNDGCKISLHYNFSKMHTLLYIFILKMPQKAQINNIKKLIMRYSTFMSLLWGGMDYHYVLFSKYHDTKWVVVPV